MKQAAIKKKPAITSAKALLAFVILFIFIKLSFARLNERSGNTTTDCNGIPVTLAGNPTWFISGVVAQTDTIVTINTESTYTLPSGKIINTTGNYGDTLKNKNGCDTPITNVKLKVVQNGCQVSSGTPIVNETFGSGVNVIGPQLPDGVTNMEYVKTPCPAGGQYSIVNYTSGCFENDWHTITDHTGNKNGYFMLINASKQPSDFFVQTVNGLCQGTTYKFSSWVLNVDSTNQILPNITFTIEKTDGTILGGYSSGDIPRTKSAKWVQYGFYFTTPSGISTVVIRMHNNAPGGYGNDIALDDIAFAPAGPSTVIGINGTKSDTVHTLCNNKVSLFSTVGSCYIQNTYQWQNSTDGITWTDISGSSNPDYTINLQSTGIYSYRLQVAENGNINNIKCRTNSNAVTVFYDRPASKNISPAICQGASYLLPSGKTINATGLYSDTLLNKQGCDSLITKVNLKVNNVRVVDTTVSICSGDYYKLPSGKSVNSIGIYNDTLHYKSGCDSVITITHLQVASLTPFINIRASANNICAGTFITFTATPTNGGSSPTYQWKVNSDNAGKNDTTFTSNKLTNGDTVACTMTSNAVCATPGNITSNNITLIIYPLPVVNAGGNKTISEGSSTILNATATGNITDITWSPSSGLSNNKSLTPIASPVSTTIYTLVVQTTDGCLGIDAAKVTVSTYISIPNTFSPNGDGINDLWDIKNLNDYPGCLVEVFDRYGQEVYQSRGYYKPWDGTLNRKPLPVGTYYYIIKLNNGNNPLSGYVVILR